MLCAKDAVVRPEDVDDDLGVSAPVSGIVEDEDGCELDLREVIALQRVKKRVRRLIRDSPRVKYEINIEAIKDILERMESDPGELWRKAKRQVRVRAGPRWCRRC